MLFTIVQELFSQLLKFLQSHCKHLNFECLFPIICLFPAFQEIVKHFCRWSCISYSQTFNPQGFSLSQNLNSPPVCAAGAGLVLFCRAVFLLLLSELLSVSCQGLLSNVWRGVKPVGQHKCQGLPGDTAVSSPSAGQFPLGRSPWWAEMCEGVATLANTALLLTPGVLSRVTRRPWSCCWAGRSQVLPRGAGCGVSLRGCLPTLWTPCVTLCPRVSAAFCDLSGGGLPGMNSWCLSFVSLTPCPFLPPDLPPSFPSVVTSAGRLHTPHSFGPAGSHHGIPLLSL